MDTKLHILKIPYGLFGLNGEWQHNPLLQMTRDEQYEWNVKNGYLEKR